MHELLLKFYAKLPKKHIIRGMKVAQDEVFFQKMKEGRIYRRSDLLQYSSAVDRHLGRLVKDKKVVKVSGGLYVRPKSSAFGSVPPDERDLVRAFLKDDRFLVSSYSNYNQLGLGLTQIYQNSWVYNYKRFGEFELGGRKFFFKRVPKFPKTISKEFLLVDLVNNLNELAEDEFAVIENLKANQNNFESRKVLDLVEKYGRARTKKILKAIYS